jgi:hypothetical protein
MCAPRPKKATTGKTPSGATRMVLLLSGRDCGIEGRAVEVRAVHCNAPLSRCVSPTQIVTL